MDQEVVSSLKIASGENFPGRDIRPRLKDGYGITYLLDSGSMCCVWPAGPEDRIDENIILEAVDGKKFDCYGKKELEIKLGRKVYKIEAVIAKVKAPLLGWDFNRKYRLDLIWGDFGDLFLRDKKAKIARRLEHVSIPQDSIPRFSSVEVKPAAATEFEIFGAKIVKDMAAEENEKPEIHKKEYLELLDKYKEILKLNFKEAKTKHGIEHKIPTTGSPTKAKVRPLLPGSPKAEKGFQAWKELHDLGIIEKS